ncbi:mannose-1-phosphate guanylyltransferase [Mangrovibacterium marinum]|uniref:mannose-1-phosphate guanylyltransferase n=1 Tax=Mangrovibacterium marinum TaxID=1639118 RepID=A0A2T5C6L2_9BACT|nr:mannose-1-phosphate guanylyltransferase [Mangrovibacterium marinum]PTN10593.1 mannose-1-phosphate guanylyltransferase [Mangrovibacterium marinum]
MKNTYCVIMAGGVGSRFWPLSKTSMPKQFLDILGTGRTFIQMTFDRFKKICPIENFMIVTNVEYRNLVRQQLPELGEDQILLEPLRRNTAPCIAYATNRIKAINPNATIVVSPADHLILNVEEFLFQLKTGIEFAGKNKALLTLGIPPSRPETGFGYIQIENKIENDNTDHLYKVKTFTEKPSLEMARIFIDSGEFYWNSGIFIWSVDAISEAYAAYLPDMYERFFTKGEDKYGTSSEVFFINKAYSECQNTSVDYAIMEKADNVYVLCAEFGWSDVGTWGALYAQQPKNEDNNVVQGENVFMYDTQNSIVNVTEDKITVLQGLDDYIVVETDDILLVCQKEKEQQIRHFVNDVKLQKGNKFA